MRSLGSYVVTLFFIDASWINIIQHVCSPLEPGSIWINLGLCCASRLELRGIGVLMGSGFIGFELSSVNECGQIAKMVGCGTYE